MIALCSIGGYQLEDCEDVLAEGTRFVLKNARFQPVAHLWLTRTGHLGTIWVDNDYRGSGLASYLLDKAEARAKEWGLTRVSANTHETNQAMISLLRRRGYFSLVTLEKRLG